MKTKLTHVDLMAFLKRFLNLSQNELESLTLDGVHIYRHEVKFTMLNPSPDLMRQMFLANCKVFMKPETVEGNAKAEITIPVDDYDPDQYNKFVKATY